MRFHDHPRIVIKIIHMIKKIIGGFVRIIDIYEPPEVMFPINFNTIDQFQWKYPGITAKLKITKYKWGPLLRGMNNNFNPIT